MAGFAARTLPATGAHDPLELRAIAVSALDDPRNTSLLMVADLIALDGDTVAEMSALVATRLGLSAGQISIGVTHTHGGPAVTGTRLGGRADPAYMRQLAEAAVDCADRALRAQSSATVCVGRGEVHGVGHNRRASECVVDPTVHAVVLRGLDGDLLGVLFSYACHPVVLGPDNRLITADWPGFARAHLERSLGVPTIFAQGCAGQINTGHSAEDSLLGRPSVRRTFEEAERIGKAVAQAAERAVYTALDAAPPVEVAHLPRAGPATVSTASEVVALPFRSSAADALSVPVVLHRWGDARLLCLPGEPFVEMALDTRAATGDPDLLVLGYTGGVPGYLPYPPALYDNGGYEVCEAHHFYGQRDAFAPEAGLALRAASDRLLGVPGASGGTTTAS